jgi:hypothetical protein
MDARSVRATQEKRVQRRLVAQQQHEAVVIAERINRDVFEAGLLHWYETFFQRERQRTEDAQFVAREKERIWRLRLNRKKEAAVERRLRHEESQTIALRDERISWIQKSEADIERRVVDLGAHLEHCCLDPQTTDEHAIRTSLMRDAKAQHLKQVLREADARGDKFETPDGLRVALDCVISERQAADKVSAQNDMTLALSDFDHMKRAELQASEGRRVVDYNAMRCFFLVLTFVAHCLVVEQERARKDTRLSELDRRYAINVIQLAYRAYQARCALRAIATSVYRMKFDTVNFQAYWSDTRSDDVWYTKPLALGEQDLSFEDEWIEARDSSGALYFVNFLQMRMQWEQPPAPLTLRASEAKNLEVEADAAAGPCCGPLKKETFCMTCNEVVPKLWCVQCSGNFCVECFRDTHRASGSKRRHVFHKTV